MDIKTLLGRGTVDVTVRENIIKKLEAGKKLRIKFGIDPTGSALHIGHAVPLKKLRQFQDAGHTAILLIGDYTARIGDPTGKSETRTMLSEEDIQKNMKTYIEQASKVLNTDKLEIRYNSEWFGKLNMGEILEMVAKRSVQQMLHRSDFKNRFEKGEEISLTEFIYPVMQGFDSVMLESDIEIGGTDQLFNLLVGRDMQKGYDKKIVQDIITVPILEGTDGVEKMSKSFNNFIGLTESPKEIFGKTMSIPDELIIKYFELATNVSLEEIEEISNLLKSGENPKNVKMRLGKELVTLYHDAESGEKAAEEFNQIFKDKGVPQDIETLSLKQNEWNIVDLIIEAKFAESKGEARRLIDGGGVRINDEKIADTAQQINISEETILQVGKRKFIKLKAK